MHDIWNPWHGCVKVSEGCENCYMYFLDRKITAELAPKREENDGNENNQEPSQQPRTKVKTVSVKTTDPPQEHKPSMVAEPSIDYPNKGFVMRNLSIKTGIELDYK